MIKNIIRSQRTTQTAVHAATVPRGHESLSGRTGPVHLTLLGGRSNPQRSLPLRYVKCKLYRSRTGIKIRRDILDGLKRKEGTSMPMLKLAICALLTASCSLADTVLFNDFGPSDQLSDNFLQIGGATSFIGFPGQSQAFAFAPTTTADLDQLDLALGVVFGTARLTIALTTDSAGHPGSVLESLSVLRTHSRKLW